jgi:putative ATPase
MINLPLAVRMRPKTLGEVVGQDHITKQGVLSKFFDDRFTNLPASILLWGPPGSGKTTIAYILGTAEGRRFVELSATSSSVKQLREVIDEAKHLYETGSIETILFIDEIHRFSKSQQDVLLPFVENKTVTLIAATTENPSFSVITPLLSRSITLTLNPVSDEDLESVIKKALKSELQLKAAPGVVKLIAELSNGDVRKALTVLEVSASGVSVTGAGVKQPEIAASPVAPRNDALSGNGKLTKEVVYESIDKAFVQFDPKGDNHYDTASAFIKSMRGSDVDAAIHYLARMLEGGEDPRFIARRIMILASEDIGMADPNALVIASAAANVVEKIGLPEARLTLSEAVIYMATAPKSNAAYTAINAAQADIQEGNIGTVPKHLRDAHYKGAAKLGHGLNYEYPHDLPASISNQQYLPDKIKNVQYYNPSNNGHEAEIKTRLQKIKSILRRN